MYWTIGPIEGCPGVAFWKGIVPNISFAAKLTRISLVNIVSLEIDACCSFCTKADIDLKHYFWTGELVRKMTFASLYKNIKWGGSCRFPSFVYSIGIIQLSRCVEQPDAHIVFVAKPLVLSLSV